MMSQSLSLSVVKRVATSRVDFVKQMNKMLLTNQPREFGSSHSSLYFLWDPLACTSRKLLLPSFQTCFQSETMLNDVDKLKAFTTNIMGAAANVMPIQFEFYRSSNAAF